VSARRGSSYVELPAGWERVAGEGPGPFVTTEVLRRPDGKLVRWRSREHRKRRRAPGERVGVWWRPDRLGWWIGVLFAIGSLCFVLAAVASQWASSPRPAIGVTFFVGSIFFTSAAYLQYWQVVNVEHAPTGAREGLSLRRRLRPASWEPGRIDWLSALVQLVGTVFFNISTFAAMKTGLSAKQSDLRVWTPDVLGSICFLVSTELAYAEVCGRWLCLRRSGISWWIVALNLAGSVFFGLSAIASVIEPSTSEPLAAHLANATTALGALGFLIASVLLLPETAKEPAAATAPAEPAASASG